MTKYGRCHIGLIFHFMTSFFCMDISCVYIVLHLDAAQQGRMQRLKLLPFEAEGCVETTSFDIQGVSQG